MRISEALVFALLLVGCRKDSDGFIPVGTSGCDHNTLDPNVSLSTGTHGGIRGVSHSRHYLDDGRIIDSEGPAGVTPRSVVTMRMPAERLKKLDQDIAATGLFTLKPGCWNLKQPHADGVARGFSIRHEGRIFQFGGDSTMPPAVEQAARLIHELDVEVDAARPGNIQDGSVSP